VPGTPTGKQVCAGQALHLPSGKPPGKDFVLLAAEIKKHPKGSEFKQVPLKGVIICKHPSLLQDAANQADRSGIQNHQVNFVGAQGIRKQSDNFKFCFAVTNAGSRYTAISTSDNGFLSPDASSPNR